MTLGSGDRWSGDDVREWITEVEAPPAFSTPLATSPWRLEIGHEQI